MTAFDDHWTAGGSQSGVLALNWETYEILYLDQGMRRMLPNLQPGLVCYKALGCAEPCAGCPVSRLDRIPLAGGTQPDPNGDHEQKLIATRLVSEDGHYALVFRSTLYTPFAQDQEQVERQLGYLIHMSCDSVMEVHLDNGTYTGYSCDADTIQPRATRGKYQTLLDNLMRQAKDPQDAAQFEPLALESMRERLAQSESRQEYAVRFTLMLDGHESMQEWKVVLLQDPAGPIAFLLCSDITSRTLSSDWDAPPEDHWMQDERSDAVLQQMQSIAFEYLPQTEEFLVSPQIGRYLAGRFDQRPFPRVLLEDGVVSPEDREVFQEFFRNSGSIQRDSVLLRLRARDGISRWYRLSISMLPAGTHGIPRMIGSISNVDEEARLRESLRYRSEYDLVTGIYNKATFFKRTEALLWEESDLSHSLLRLDVDRFKMVNDLFGIPEGDALLHFIGKCIQCRMKPNETYARMSDDVFCMCVSRSDEEVVALVQELGEEMSAYPLAFKLVLSTGIYRIQCYSGEPINVMCDRAGLAQKMVKGSFVRRFAFYDPQMGQKLFLEQEIISEMHRAISEQQFVVYLQPQYDMRNNVVFGAEALVRWEHPVKGLIPPSEFIPIFEKNGFIMALDEYVWDAVCKMINRWIGLGYRPIPISVNVSRLHLFDPQFCEKIIRLVERYNLPPHLVELELTESAYVENSYFLTEVMEKLHNRGFTFLMDDFGSGYSSLNMLRTIAVDVLKIDLAFLRECQEGTAGRIILESIIEMAQRLRLPIIAEGVENQEQVTFLLNVGCSLAQGYFYAKPMPAECFEQEYYGGRTYLTTSDQQ